MGGRYAKGSRPGSWAKRLQQLRVKSDGADLGPDQLAQLKQNISDEVRAELAKEIEERLQKKSTMEKEAAMMIAKDLALEVKRLTDANRCLKAANWHLKSRRKQRAKPLVSLQGSAGGSLEAAKMKEALLLMVGQVNAMKEENLLLNRARFRCPKCG